VPLASRLYSSVSRCNITVYRRYTADLLAPRTVGLFDWCSALEENGLAVNVLTGEGFSQARTEAPGSTAGMELLEKEAASPLPTS